MIRRTTFISYHHADATEVRRFIDRFRAAIIPRGIGDGVSDDDNFVNSTDTDYVLRRIREKYLANSSVTIVMIGACTWARKYVDWEIAASLRNDPVNGRNGLIGIWLPSSPRGKLPERLQANRPKPGQGYARVYAYPDSATQLAGWLTDAYNARTARARLIVPRSPLKVRNSPC